MYTVGGLSPPFLFPQQELSRPLLGLQFLLVLSVTALTTSIVYKPASPSPTPFTSLLPATFARILFYIIQST
jgi:hypothetical protein